MEKRTETSGGSERVNPSDEEVWCSIRYLDHEPDDASAAVLIVVFVVLFILVPVLGLIYFR